MAITIPISDVSGAVDRLARFRYVDPRCLADIVDIAAQIMHARMHGPPQKWRSVRVQPEPELFPDRSRA